MERGRGKVNAYAWLIACHQFSPAASYTGNAYSHYRSNTLVLGDIFL